MRLLREFISFAVVLVATSLVASILVIAVGSDITKAFNSFFDGIFGSFYSITEVLVRATPLILAGLGVAVAFRFVFSISERKGSSIWERSPPPGSACICLRCRSPCI